MIPQSIFERILNDGSASMSLQTLYTGYEYFSHSFEDELGVIAYVDTATSWVGASEPIVSSENLVSLLKKFQQAAAKKNKTALILPVSREVAEVARAQNFFVAHVGNEPWYSTHQERPNPSAKTLLRKGAHVERFDPHLLSVEERLQLDDLTARWRATRKMADLSFLNRVEPWQLFREKKYFRLIFHEQQVAYLAAVPVKARNAWYLVDLIRDPRSPPGATELILQEGSRLLKEDGAREFTLGMSPFSEPDAGEKTHNPLLYWTFRMIFDHVEFFYGFKTLFQYKQKFNPDRWEPQYFIALEEKVSLKTLIGLGTAIFPKGVLYTSGSTVWRVITRFSFSNIYQKFLNHRIVPKSPPENLWSFITRAKFTVTLSGLSILYFFTSTDEHFHIRKTMVDRYAYSLQHLFYGHSPTRGFIDLMIASFLHWDPLHVLTNLLCSIFFVGLFECVVGTTLTLLVFFFGILLANPLTSLLLSPIYFISHERFSIFFQEPDIGSSLGIFACIGALSWFVKKPGLLILLMALSAIVYNLCTQSLLGYNHLIALAIGYGIGKRYVLSN